MALNLRTLGIRSLSALVFVFILLGSLLWNYLSFALFFFIVAIIGLNEFYKMAEKMGARPFRVCGFILAVLVYLSFVNLQYFFPGYELHGGWSWPVIIISPFIIFCTALFSKNEMPVQNALFTFTGIIYVVLPFALIHEMVSIPDIGSYRPVFYPTLLLGMILLIWSNDTFAYLGGSLFGRNKMIPAISPGKTWEGTIFGILVTFGLSFLIKKLLFKQEFNLFILLGVLVPILATVGDLVESMLKRQAGVKDSGQVMPGHGGILDRFDSFIFVSPFLFVIWKVWSIIWV